MKELFGIVHGPASQGVDPQENERNKPIKCRTGDIDSVKHAQPSEDGQAPPYVQILTLGEVSLIHSLATCRAQKHTQESCTGMKRKDPRSDPIDPVGVGGSH